MTKNEPLMLAGRISGAPISIAAIGDAFSDFFVILVPNGGKPQSWAALRPPECRLDRPLVDGAAIALIGTVDPERPSGVLHGPITVHAVLGLTPEGEILRNA